MNNTIVIPSSSAAVASDRCFKLGVWASDDNNFRFLDPILQRLPQRYAVHKFCWSLETPKEERIRRLTAELASVDLAWFEWATGPAVEGSYLTGGIPAVCRLHRFEAYSLAPRHICWENIDCLIFIAKGVQQFFERHHHRVVPRLAHTEVIPNAIAVDAFPFKQDLERGFNLAFLGRLHMVKNPMMLVHIMARLIEEDPRYRLHIAGGVQDDVVMQYLQYHIHQLGLTECIRFYGTLTPEQVRAWLLRHHYILSTSFIEGHPIGVMEAMASGLKPVIHDFTGARDIFPDEFLFNTIDEAVAMILDKTYEPAYYRQFIQEHYDQTQQVEAVTRVLDALTHKAQPGRMAS